MVRCSEEKDAYKDTVYWLQKLEAVGVPTSKVIEHGEYADFEYLILTYWEGRDIGLVYEQLTDEEKREIAKKVVEIQERVSELEFDDTDADWHWKDCFFILCIDVLRGFYGRTRNVLYG